MHALQNLKTSLKLIIGFGILGLTILIEVTIGGYYLSSINRSLNSAYNNALSPTISLSKANEAFLFIRGDVYKYVVSQAERKAIRTEIEEYTVKFNGAIQDYRKVSHTQAEDEELPKLQVAWDMYQKSNTDALRLVDGGSALYALTILNEGEAHQAREATQASLTQLINLNDQVGVHLRDQGIQTFNQATMVMIVAGLLGLFIAGGAGVVITRSIVTPLGRIVQVAQGIASGALDISARVDIHSADEMGEVAAAFNHMTARLGDVMQQEREQTDHMQHSIDDYSAFMSRLSAGDLAARLTLQSNGHGHNNPLQVLGHNLNEMAANLQGMISQIREASNDLTTASAEILAATTQQASGSSEQSAAIAQTSTTVDEVKAIGEQAVLRSQEVYDAANRTVAVSRDGQTIVSETIESMARIKERVEGIAENILALSEQTQQIGEIIATVSEIASQSNMLALNASVEAARAGEQGKGFAVVAGEVRSLAEQSRQATAQVKAILQDIQKATNATVMATEEGTKVVEQGVRLAGQTQEIIEQLSGVINESAQRSSQVMAGGRQQVSGVEQVAVAMQNINQAMIQSLASTRQAERAAQDLNALAHHLSDMVKRYAV
jgi:methyl-accepting chemotaxis protein